ncbi:hypothetical protein H5410_047599, partial [Solanum commersonii]
EKFLELLLKKEILILILLILHPKLQILARQVLCGIRFVVRIILKVLVCNRKESAQKTVKKNGKARRRKVIQSVVDNRVLKCIV